MYMISLLSVNSVLALKKF